MAGMLLFSEKLSEPSRAMVAFIPAPELAARLALAESGVDDGVEYADQADLHVTLSYYPEVLPSQVEALISQVGYVAGFTRPFVTRLTGVAEFAAGDDGVPVVMLVELTRELRSLYDALGDVMAARRSDKYGFTPHMTLAYSDEQDAVEPPAATNEELTVNSIWLVIGEERHEFLLGQPSREMMPGVAAAYRSRMEIDEAPGAFDATARPGVESVTTANQDSGPRGWMRKVQNIFSPRSEQRDEQPVGESVRQKSVLIAGREGSNFAVYKQADGTRRWMALSSNGFQDRDREIIPTGVLEAAVLEADAVGAKDRGPLRLFHTPGSEIGYCDWQAMEGRFLMESGVLYDTEWADKAVEKIQSSEEDFGISIGFLYPEDSFDGQTYSKISRIVERSILPTDWASNPYTSFGLLETKSMEAPKRTFLTNMLGAEAADGLLSSVRSAGEALEKSVAFKSAREKAEQDDTGDLEKVAPKDEEEEVVEVEGGAVTAQSTVETIQAALAALTASESKTRDDLTSAIKEVTTQVGSALTSISRSISALNERLDENEEKATKSVTVAPLPVDIPRAAAVFRASEAGAELSADAVAAIKAINGDVVQPTNYIAPYIADLLGSRGA